MINYIEKGFGLHEHLMKNGCYIEQMQNGVWVSNLSDEITNQMINDYNPWQVEKAKKFAEIDSDFQAATDALTDGWPEGEIKTWGKQEAEARAYKSNPTTPTPMLSAIAYTRGITVDVLATKVLRDADLFSAASAYYVGLRHKARQLVQQLPNEGNYHQLTELWSIKFKE